MNDSEVPKLKHTNGNTISINENPFVIGRALNCNYVIPNAQISRQHCSIEKVDGAWFFRDISTNGCYLNGTLVKKDSKRLLNNDIIGLCLDGSYDFIFQISQTRRDISISDEQLNMVADTVLNEIEVSTVPITEISSAPVQEMRVGSVSDTSLKRTRIEHTPSISHIGGTSNFMSSIASLPICDNSATNQEAISTVLNEIEVSTVPISEISTIPVQEMPVVSVPDTSAPPKRPRLELLPSSSNMDNTSNVLSSAAPLPICDNSETNLQRISTTSETSSLQSPSEIVEPPSLVDKPEETNIAIPPLPEQQYEEMEDEMMCSICSEMFFKAVTLNCSHTFCKYCIDKWKKNRNICPICRTTITTMNATLVLDNVIQKIVKTLPEDDQKRRVEVMEERDREMRPPPITQTATRGRGRGRGWRGNRGGRGATRGNTHNYQPHMAQINAPRFPNAPLQVIPTSSHLAAISGEPAAPAIATIEVSDEEDDENEDSNGETENSNEANDYNTDSELSTDSDMDWDDDDDYYERDRPYYGGYGYCFACGAPDHWANSCPNRRR